MFQSDLFEATPLALVDDAESGIRYLPDVVPQATAQAWFEQALELLEAHPDIRAGLEQAFASFEQLEQVSTDWPLRRLVAIWNHLPAIHRVSRFENRSIGLQRIWRVLNASAGEGKATPVRRQRRGRRNERVAG